MYKMDRHEWCRGDKFVIYATDDFYVRKVREQNLVMETTFYREGEIISVLGNGNAIVYFSKKCQNEFDTIPLVLLTYVSDADPDDVDFVPFKPQRTNHRNAQKPLQKLIRKKRTRKKPKNFSPTKRGVLSHVEKTKKKYGVLHLKADGIRKVSNIYEKDRLHWTSRGYQLVD